MKSRPTREDLIETAISNIEKDRAAALELLESVSEFIGQQRDRFATSGMVAAKYLETLQRSNEQLVKIVALSKKSTEDPYGNLDKKDKEELYKELEEDD